MNNEITFNDVPRVLLRIEQRIERMEKYISSFEAKEPKRYVNIDGLSEHTGWAKQTIYGKVSRGEIPFTKRGKFLYFDLDKIDAMFLIGEHDTDN